MVIVRRPTRVACLTAAALLGSGLLGSCASSAPHPGPTGTSTAAHAVTSGEADRLAVSRFLNYQAGGVHFRARLVADRTPLTVVGDVDYHRRTGYALVSGTGTGFVLQWNATDLVAWPAEPGASEAPSTLPTGKPSTRALAPSTSDVDALLAVLLSLGQDRPDNAQLIRQDGARWLRAATVGASRVDVIAGPRAPGSSGSSGASPLTYWVDRTGHLLRVDAHFGGADAPTRITLDTRAFAAFPRSGLLTS